MRVITTTQQLRSDFWRNHQYLAKECEAGITPEAREAWKAHVARHLRAGAIDPDLAASVRLSNLSHGDTT